MNVITKHAKRLSRKKVTAEDFTPKEMVNQMLDKLLEYSPDIFTDPNKTFLDPAAGNGNILIEVLKRKMAHTDPLQALSTIYGCDIKSDNILECRLRLLKCVIVYGDIKTKEDILKALRTLWKNIAGTSLCRHPNGSLDYLAMPKGKTFHWRGCDKARNYFYNVMQSQKLLEKVTI